MMRRPGRSDGGHDRKTTKDNISNANRPKIFTFVYLASTIAFQHYAGGRLRKIYCRDIREHAAHRLHKTINNAELDAGKIENAY